jgi:serine/threonine protein kinase
MNNASDTAEDRQRQFDTCCRWLYAWKRISHSWSDEQRERFRTGAPCSSGDPLAPNYPVWVNTEIIEMGRKPRLKITEITRSFPQAGISESHNQACLGEYRLVEVVFDNGNSGMSTLFKAVRLEDKLEATHRLIKICNAQKMKVKQEEADRRFRDECELQSSIQHDHVVETIGVGKEPVRHLVMDFVYGPTLHDLLDHHAEGPLPVELAIDLTLQIARGIRAFHRHPKRIIHRDLKPANVLLEQVPCSESYTHGWRVRICDFGLAISAVTDRKTRISERIFGFGVGTRFHQAPEQLIPNEVIDLPCDVFLLGICAYMMLTGKTPFVKTDKRGNSVPDTSFPKPVSIGTINSKVPEGISELLDRMLAKEASERPQIEEVIAGLQLAWVNPESYEQWRGRIVQDIHRRLDVLQCTDCATNIRECVAQSLTPENTHRQSNTAALPTRNLSELIVDGCIADVLLIKVNDLLARYSTKKKDHVKIRENLGGIVRHLVPFQYDRNRVTQLHAEIQNGAKFILGYASTKAVAELIMAALSRTPFTFRTPLRNLPDEQSGLTALQWDEPPEFGTVDDTIEVYHFRCAHCVIEQLYNTVAVALPPQWRPLSAKSLSSELVRSRALSQKDWLVRTEELAEKLTVALKEIAKREPHRRPYCLISSKDQSGVSWTNTQAIVKVVQQFVPGLLFFEVDGKNDSGQLGITQSIQYFQCALEMNNATRQR